MPECKIIKSFELIFNIYFVICNYEYKGRRRTGLSDKDLQWNHARAITTMFYSGFCKKIKVTMDRQQIQHDAKDPMALAR